MTQNYDNWNDAKALIFPRVDRPDAVTSDLCITPELGVELVLRTESGEIPIRGSALEQWGVSAMDAAAQAVANLREVAEDGTDWLEVPSAPALFALYAEDGDAASRMLVLDELLDVPIAGVLVAVPTRNQMVVLPLADYEDLQDLATLALGAQLAARASSRPLSTQLFYFDGSSWTTLHVKDEPGETEILPSPGLAAALETLAAQSLAPMVAEA
ncbi:MAG: hypothetical protein EP330_00815 [Deltaproteobacteria bacterium]|nr:MAG: hypothetical protein EP330_00815 [Deltaproteobacteria bacterium]